MRYADKVNRPWGSTSVNIERFPGLAINFKKILFLAVAGLLIYFALFAINLAGSKRQLAELERLTEARESAANLRGSLSRLVLEDSRLDNRRAVPAAAVEQLKLNANQAAATL